VFRGRGWDGIESHWRARHLDVASYEKFWNGLCPAHGGAPALGCPSCHKGIALGVKQCPECAQVFQGRSWAGIRGHWRSKHADVMSDEQFWMSLCPGHRGDSDPATGFLPIIGGRG
jgi:hypothetical protein